MFQFSDDAKLIAKGAFWGAIGGAAVLALIGFNFGGWVTGGTAARLAAERANAAVVQALTPVCAEMFLRAASAEQKAEMMKTDATYSRGDLVRKVVQLPGVKELSYNLAGDCGDAVARSFSAKN